MLNRTHTTLLSSSSVLSLPPILSSVVVALQCQVWQERDVPDQKKLRHRYRNLSPLHPYRKRLRLHLPRNLLPRHPHRSLSLSHWRRNLRLSRHMWASDLSLPRTARSLMSTRAQGLRTSAAPLVPRRKVLPWTIHISPSVSERRALPYHPQRVLRLLQ